MSLDQLVEDGFSPVDHGSGKVEAGAELNQILKHIETLDEKYSQVLLLRFVEDLGPKDIAKIVGESENNISVRINRGLAQLRQTMGGGNAPNMA